MWTSMRAYLLESHKHKVSVYQPANPFPWFPVGDHTQNIYGQDKRAERTSLSGAGSLKGIECSGAKDISFS